MKFYHEKIDIRQGRKTVPAPGHGCQTNNAPFVTRAEAHERVVSRARPPGIWISMISPKGEIEREFEFRKKRRWLIPYMGEASRFGAAAVRRTSAFRPRSYPLTRSIARVCEQVYSHGDVFPLRA